MDNQEEDSRHRGGSGDWRIYLSDFHAAFQTAVTVTATSLILRVSVQG